MPSKKYIRPPRTPLTQKLVKDLFDYFDGRLYWKSSMKGTLAGSEAGNVSPKGYMMVGIKSHNYLLHRVIWLWHKGYMPEGLVDHEDQDKSNNRIENLREASKKCNAINSGVPCNSTSGVRGVSLFRGSERWRATIQDNGNGIYLGLYKNFEDAVMARWEKEVEFKWPNCSTTSSAFLYLKSHNLLQEASL